VLVVAAGAAGVEVVVSVDFEAFEELVRFLSALNTLNPAPTACRTGSISSPIQSDRA
jgi:hypothetical protein